MIQKLDINSRLQFWLFSLLFVTSYGVAVGTDNYYFLLAPAAVIGVYASLTGIKLLFFSLLFFLPISTEVQLPGGFSTDFPDELIMVGLMFLTFAYLAIYPQKFNKALLYNPVILVLLIHFLWIVVTAAFSAKFIISFKYTLSKTWYLTVFVILASMIIKDLETFKKVFWLITIPLLYTVIYTLNRHSQHYYSFQSVNLMMAPYFRNHVNYAAMISEWIPFVWLATTWYKKDFKLSVFLYGLLALFIVALFFSYTRSSWLALIASVGITIVIRFRLVKYLLAGIALCGILAVAYITHNNKFLDYAPNFEKTIYHEELGAHLTSTYKMQDISSAERIYRWVAAMKMWKQHPIAGFGPGNFYSFYKGYTVSSFRTYVSANGEHSTVHNYFILMLVEQGVIGFLIFCLLTATIFIYGQKIYHDCQDKQTRNWILAIIMSLAAIYVNTFLSDMIETDKVGTIYFLNIALLAVIGYNIYKKPLAVS